MNNNFVNIILAYTLSVLAGCLFLSTSYLQAGTTVFPRPDRVSAGCGQRVELELCRNQTTPLTLTPLSDEGLPTCNYLWLTRYNLTGNVTDRSVQARPARDTCYLVQVDCNGCFAVDTICVRIVDVVNIRITPGDTTVCQNSSVNFRGFGATELTWSPAFVLQPSTGPTVRFQADTTRTLTVTGRDANGCDARGQVRITVIPPPLVTFPYDSVLCTGDTIQLIAGDPESDVRYDWLPRTGLVFEGATERVASFRAGSSIIYSIDLTDTIYGCSNRTTFILNVVPHPTAMLDGPLRVCEGQTTVWRLSGASRYFWIDWPEPGFYASQTFAPTESKTFHVVPFNDKCKGDTVSLELMVLPRPTIQWALPRSGCTRDSIVIQLISNFASDDSLKIESGSLVLTEISRNDTSRTYKTVANQAGFAALQATITNAAGCVSDDRDVLQVETKPTADAGRNRSICAGDSVRIQGSSPEVVPGECNIEWSGGARITNPFALETLAWPDTTTLLYLTARCGLCISEPDSVLLTVYPTPVLVADTNRLSFCRDQSGIRLPIRIEGGTAPYFVRWEPPYALDDPLSIAPFAIPEVDTFWRVSLLDSFRCEAKPLQIFVKVNEYPIASAGPNIFRCSDNPQVMRLQGAVWGRDSVPVPANQLGRYEIAWQPATGLSDSTIPNPVAHPESNTIYTLRIRDKLTGCSSKSTTLDTLSTATVYVVPRVQADAGSDSSFVCVGNGIQIGGGAIGGDSLQFNWVPSSGLSDAQAQYPVAKPERNTLYRLEVKSEGCASDVDSIWVIVRNLPVLRLDDAPEVCAGDTVTLRPVISGGNLPYQLTWNREARVFQDATGVWKCVPQWPFTKVKAQVSDRYCTHPLIQELVLLVYDRPQVFIEDSDTIICAGDSIVLNSRIESNLGQYSLAWKPQKGLSATNEVNPMASPDESIVYTLEAVSGNCRSIDSIFVGVQPTPILALDSIAPACSGDTVRLIASTNPAADEYEWTWTDGNRERNLLGPNLVDVPDSTTRYIIRATLGLCTSLDTVYANIYPLATAKFELSGVSGCGPWTVAFRDVSLKSRSRLWDFGNGLGFSSLKEPTYRYLLPDTYRVVLIANPESPCPDTAALSLPLLTLPLGRVADLMSEPTLPTILYLPEARVQVTRLDSSARQFIWEFGDGHSSLAYETKHQYEVAGNYFIRQVWEDSAGCVWVDSLPLLEVREPEIYIPKVFTPNGDGFGDGWNLVYQGVESIQVEVYDRWGQRVFVTKVANDLWNGTNTSGQAAPTGAYIYHIAIGGRSYRGTVSLLR